MTEQAYNTCVNQYADNVYRFILKNLRHAEDARDIVQTAFERMWLNRNEVEESRAKTFLFTVAYRAMIDHIRKQKRVVLKDRFDENTRVQQPVSSHARQLLQEAVQQLSETQQHLVMLKDFEGYSYEEIGTITGLNASQVKVYLHRARLHLRNYIVHPENVL